MDPTLAALPCDLIYMVADYLETLDLCNFAATSPRNWAILQDTCHKEALRVAGPTPEDYEKFRANRGHGFLTLINMERTNIFWKRRSLLIKAVSYGRLNIARSFLDHGIDPNSYNIHGKRLLNFAVILYRLPRRAVEYTNSARRPLPLGENSSGAYEMIELLLSYGADPSLSDVDDPNTTPLALATESGMSPHVCLLIKNGAYVNQRGVLGKICSSCNMQALQCAIDAGAMLDTLRSEGVSLLYLAAENEDVEILEYLLKAGLGSQVNEVHRGRTPLIRAIETENEHNVLSLLEHGADPNALHPTTNQSALQLACEFMLPSTSVNALIQAGADINHEDTFGLRALHVAVIKGQAGTVRAILESGKPFDITARDLDGHTALEYAMMPVGFRDSTREIIQMLLIAEARARIEDDSR
ncbi:uncharacterized protein BHQ10_008445 [Talaromyces amestolkiae]|uniref:F-box domain-containing protein n=1 Tax=Talaromyces amestolkiae TaxID=1196081 RepID=A0A364L9I2_TALAM|nr:uncharacterized protein BHQ10_008445 [Talaromyces amestolkiae]RAO72433.1 hypothetical protein BHQ10_008445 [Talaromyces amestolkiae]